MSTRITDYYLCDYHTHNGYYRGSAEEWTYMEGWNIAQAKGIQQLGIANKVEFNHPNPEFIPLLRKELDLLHNSSLFLGIELDIGDPSGKTVFPTQYEKFLDYIIAGPHNTPSKTLVWAEIDSEALDEYFISLKNILLNSFKTSPITIWAHPFLQEIEISAKRYKNYITEINQEMCAFCAQKGIAIEINENYFRQKKMAKNTQETGWWISDEAFYLDKMFMLEEIFKMALSYNEIEFTFASDTHKLENVADIKESVQFAKRVGIPSNRLKKIEIEKK